MINNAPVSVLNQDVILTIMQKLTTEYASSSFCATIRDRSASRGFALVELMVIVAIIATITMIAVPTMRTYTEKSRVARAIGDIRALEKEIMSFYADNYRFPATLENIHRKDFLDPWGTPYQYMRISSGKGQAGKGGVVAACRKDKFLVPINSDYDLYSMGPDKKSQLALTAKDSRDDIIRANNGGFVGPAHLY